MNIARSRLSDRILLQLASAAELPFADSEFDLVISNSSLHHWNNPTRVLNEISRVTAASGFCLIRDNLRLPPAARPMINLTGLA